MGGGPQRRKFSVSQDEFGLLLFGSAVLLVVLDVALVCCYLGDTK